MSASAQRILEEALQLSEDERIAVASDLLESVEPPPPEQMSEKQWIAEIERRARAAQAGSPSLSWQEVRGRLEERLAKR